MECLNDASTLLVDFFSILLGLCPIVSFFSSRTRQTLNLSVPA